MSGSDVDATPYVRAFALLDDKAGEPDRGRGRPSFTSFEAAVAWSERRKAAGAVDGTPR